MRSRTTIRSSCCCCTVAVISSHHLLNRQVCVISQRLRFRRAIKTALRCRSGLLLLERRLIIFDIRRACRRAELIFVVHHTRIPVLHVCKTGYIGGVIIIATRRADTSSSILLIRAARGSLRWTCPLLRRAARHRRKSCSHSRCRSGDGSCGGARRVCGLAVSHSWRRCRSGFEPVGKGAVSATRSHMCTHACDGEQG